MVNEDPAAPNATSERFQLLLHLRRQKRLAARIGAEWTPGGVMIRPWRARTLLGREIRRRRKHYPAILRARRLPATAVLVSSSPAPAASVESLRCECGETFTSPQELERHMDGWMPALQRVRFRYQDIDGRRVAKPMPGHTMMFRRTQTGFLAACECGWSKPIGRKGEVGPAARAHVRATVACLATLLARTQEGKC